MAPKGEQARISHADRWLIVGLAGQLKWTNARIMKTMKWVGEEGVRRWAKKGREGVDDVDDEKRSGAPAKITGRTAERLRKALKNKRFATPARLAHSFSVTPQTVRNAARRLKLRPVKMQYRHRQSEAQRAYRMEWCTLRRNKSLSYWKQWVWSDEKWFYLVCRKSGEWIWVAEDDLENEVRYLPKDKHPSKVMVWAAISYDGRSSLHVFPAKTKVIS
jgi:transposase